MPGTFNRSLIIEQLECRRLLAFNPTAQEQEMLQLINRFRTDPRGEFNRLFSSTSPLVARDTTLQDDLNFFKVKGSTLKSEWNKLNPIEPLAWNETLYDFASWQNGEMIRRNDLFHSNSNQRGEALRAGGVDFNRHAELVFRKTKGTVHNFAAYAVNWGPTSDGMQKPRSHRNHLMDPTFDQIGLRITSTSASSLSPRVNTVVLADTRNAPIMVIGAVFEDKNNNRSYEAGEGRGNVTIEFEKTTGEKYSTRSLSAGGYQIAIPPGTYKVRATGGGLKHAVVQEITISNQSLWKNFIYRPSDLPPDAYEPNDSPSTATGLTGTSPSLTGLSLHADDDADFFRYVAARTGSATFQVQFSHAQGNIDLELQNSTGQVLARSTGSGNTESIVRQVEAGSVYFVRVYGKANPSYTLSITGPPDIDPDEHEPNNTRGTATRLTGASPSLAGLSLHANNDVDFFRYVAEGTGPATYRVQFSHAQGNIDLELQDAAGQVLASSAGSGNSESIVYQAEAGTVYFLKVYGQANPSYTLSISGPPPIDPDEHEPNNSRGTATRLTGASPSLAGLSLHANNDVDFFRYVAEGTGPATYRVQFSHAQGNIDLELQDSAGQVLASSAGSGNSESIVYQAEAGTVYFLKVYGQANPSYTLSISGPPAIDPDGSEPNDTLGTATLLAAPHANLANLSLHSNYDVDFFKYVAVGSGQATFELQFSHNQGNVDLQLLDAGGQVLATSDSTSNNESITRSVQRGTTYYLKVYGGPNPKYTLNISGPSPRPPVANHDQATASSATPSVSINLLSNDTNPDGTKAELVPQLASNAPTAFTLNADRTVTYQAPPGYSGVHRTTYTLTNAEGLVSAPARIEVFVVNYQQPAPWHNARRPLDVNDDGGITALDALIIINELNAGRTGQLPMSGRPPIFGFVDTSGDGRLTSLDALLIINELNRRTAGGEGEATAYPEPSDDSITRSHDLAVMQLMMPPASNDPWHEQRRRR